MYGAIAGDIIGSVYENHPIKTMDFPLFQKTSRFTDDTVMTVAVAQAVLEGGDYASSMKSFGRKYPRAGYGSAFINWIFEPQVKPYGSWGNGSAMRVSPIGLAFDTVEEVLREARLSAEVSHNHPEGVKGAQATALAVYLAHHGENKTTIKDEILQRFDYNLQRTIADIRPTYHFDVSCQGTVPEAIQAFLEASDYEESVRLTISLGGDSDTLACIAGGIAGAYYKRIPEEIIRYVRELLPDDLLNVVDRFTLKFEV